MGAAYPLIPVSCRGHIRILVARDSASLRGNLASGKADEPGPGQPAPGAAQERRLDIGTVHMSRAQATAGIPQLPAAAASLKLCIQGNRYAARLPPLTVRTTFPVFCADSTYLVASTTCSSG